VTGTLLTARAKVESKNEDAGLMRRRRGVSKKLKTAAFHTAASSLALLWAVPVAVVLMTAFRSVDELAQNGLASVPESFTLESFAEAWEKGGLLQGLLNSFAVTIPTVAISMALASLAAFGLSRYRIKYWKLILLVMLAGNLMPVQLTLVPVSRIMQTLGLYDQLAALVVVQVAFGIGFYTFVLYGFMRSIPFEIQDAAAIDGASPLRLFWQIILPLSRPSIAALSALSFTWVFNDLLWSLSLLISRSNLPITASILTLRGEFFTSWSVISAATVIAAIPCVVVFFIFQKSFIGGLTMGAVK